MPVIRISDELFREIQKYAEPLVDNFETALWKAIGKNKKGQPIRRRKGKSGASGELTPPKDFWRPVLEALVERGGRASRQEVHNAVEQKMKGQLKSGDFEVNRDGTVKWTKQVDYQRLAMVHEGLLRNNSARGVWEITDSGRQWLSNWGRGNKET